MPLVLLRAAIVIVVVVGGGAVQPAEQLQILVIDCLGMVGGVCQRQQVVLADKENHFIQCDRQIMMPGRHRLRCNAVVRAALDAHLQHIFGQVDIPPGGVLLVHRRNQDALADHDLVLDLRGKLVRREGERQRHAVHTIAQRGLHVLAVQVRQQAVAQLEHIRKDVLAREGIRLLPAGACRRVVAQQRGENAQPVPPQHQILGRVAAEAADVGACIQEAAHIQRRQHVQAEQDVAPPRAVVAHPDAAVAVHPNRRRTGVHQNALVRLQSVERLARRAGHVIAEQVVYLVVAHPAFLRVVVEKLVVALVVGQLRHLVLELEVGVDVQIHLAVGVDVLEGLLQRLLRIEDRRLVHIVPEALDALIQQHFIVVAEPAARVGVEHIGEVDAPRPDARHEGLAVLLRAEIAVLDAFLVDVVARLDLDARVDDGHKMHALRLHLGGQLRQIGERLGVDGEVLVAVHIVDVKADGIQRDAVVAVTRHNAAHLVGGHVAPTALACAERPFRRDVAAAGQSAQAVHDAGQRVLADEIHGKIVVRQRDFQRIVVGVAAVEDNLAGVIDEDAELRPRPRDDQEVVRAVQRAFVLGVAGVVAAFALVDPAALVDAAHVLAKAVQHVLGRHRVGEAAAVLRQVGQGVHVGEVRAGHDLGIEGVAGNFAIDQRNTSYIVSCAEVNFSFTMVRQTAAPVKRNFQPETGAKTSTKSP